MWDGSPRIGVPHPDSSISFLNTLRILVDELRGAIPAGAEPLDHLGATPPV